MDQKFLIELFGEEWYEVLKPFLHSQEFLKIGKTINEIRKDTPVYPEREKTFRIFKELPYSQIRCVMLSMDPYPTPNTATGIAFDNSESLKISPSLKFILQEIFMEYPELERDIKQGIDLWDLNRWVKQGVFLYNVALTVEKNKAGSHLSIWESFSREVVKSLNKQDNLVWLLLGKNAQNFSNFITNKTHRIVLAPHPASCAYNINSGFLGSGCFRQVNQYLEPEIQW